MRKFLWLSIGLGLSVFSISLKGQVNLVLNPSFENYSVCGDFGYNCGGSTINNWSAPTGGTPDWFDTCGNGISSFGMPSNYAGYQYPRSGNAYAGFGFGGGGGCPQCDYYEYIEGQLSKVLSGNKKYCVTYYVSLADSSWYASSTLGAYISTSEVCDIWSVDTLPYIPQILNPDTNILSNPLCGLICKVKGIFEMI
jgi:hypothetical protein